MTNNEGVLEACRRMRTRPSLLGKAVQNFANTINPYGADEPYDYDFWTGVYLKLDHETQLSLVNDERERSKKTRYKNWKKFQPQWMRR